MNARDFLPTQLAEDEPLDPFYEAVAELEQIARYLDLEPWITQRLLHSERELTANLGIVRDDGSTHTLVAYRVQHLTSRGPTLGAVAFSSHAHLSAVRAASIEATWQSALLNLPFGGAAGAIVCDPDELTENELRQLSKQYAHALRGVVGRDQDVLAPGAGCNEQVMAWMLDRIAQDTGRPDPAAVVGKPPALYGLDHHASMTASGLIVVLEVLLPRTATEFSGPTGLSSLHGLRVSIQGFGPFTSSTARMLYDVGARIIAAADDSGGLYNADGLEIPALQKYVGTHGVVFGFDDADPACNADVLESDCDVLITCGAERQVTVANADRIRARIVIEGAKGAVTNAAEQNLLSRGRTVVPELLANAGAAVAAFEEWNQSARFSVVSADDVHRELTNRVRATIERVVSTAHKDRTTLRRAAHLIAIDQIARGMRMMK